MARPKKAEPIRKNMAKYKKYVNAGNNPSQLHTDSEGNYIPEQLQQIKRVYLVNKSSYHEKRGQLKVIDKKISYRTDNPRSRYCSLMAKYERTREESERLYIETADLEDLFNQKVPLERHLRDTVRSIRTRYPIPLMRAVYAGLGENFTEEENEEYYTKGDC